MFSKACEYGLRALIYIMARTLEGNRASIDDIAEEVGAPRHFTAKILQDLVRKGIIQSIKGPGGGFFIENVSEPIPLSGIVMAIDGDKIFTGCGLGLKACDANAPCPLHDRFKVIRGELKQMLDETTLQSLSAEMLKGMAFLK